MGGGQGGFSCSTNWQRAAVRNALAHKFTILTGGPGTGKTTILRALVEILKAKRWDSLATNPPPAGSYGAAGESSSEAPVFREVAGPRTVGGRDARELSWLSGSRPARGGSWFFPVPRPPVRIVNLWRARSARRRVAIRGNTKPALSSAHFTAASTLIAGSPLATRVSRATVAAIFVRRGSLWGSWMSPEPGKGCSTSQWSRDALVAVGTRRGVASPAVGVGQWRTSALASTKRVEPRGDPFGCGFQELGGVVAQIRFAKCGVAFLLQHFERIDQAGIEARGSIVGETEVDRDAIAVLKPMHRSPRATLVRLVSQNLFRLRPVFRDQF